MALSSVTLASLLTDLRYRLREATADVWADAELNNYLNIAQLEIAVKLDGISDVWYGTVEDLTDPSTSEYGFATHDLSGLSIIRIHGANFIDATNSIEEIIPIYNLSQLLGIYKNSYDSSKYICAIHGQKLFYLPAQSIGATAHIYLLYSRRPTTMDGSNALDVPTEYQDLVVMFAMTKALEKVNQTARKNQIEDEIKAKLKEIKESFLEEDSGNITPVKTKSAPSG